MRHRTIAQLMTPADRVVSVPPGAHYKAIAELLDEHRIGAVPVVDADGRVLGVVSEADLLVKESDPASDPAEHHLFTGPAKRRTEAKAAGTTARQLMTAPAVTVGPDANLAEAARTMSARQVKRLVVTDPDGRLAGVVSRRDLLAVFTRPDEEILREIRQDIVLGVFWIDPDTLQITVDDGVVHLHGRVGTRGQSELLGDAVGRADGVVAVVNELDYERDDSKDRPPRTGPRGIFERRTP